MLNLKFNDVLESLGLTRSKSTDPLQPAIFAEQVTQIYGSFYSSFVATIINAPILVIVMWPAIDHSILLTWLSLILLLTLMRSYLSYQYNKASPPPEKAHLWYRRFLVGNITAAILWGTSALILFPETDFTRQIFLAFVLGGMGAGAVTSLTHKKIPIYAFLCLTLIPLQIHFFYDVSDLGNMMGIMLILYFIMLAVAANRAHIGLNQNIRLKIESLAREQSLQESEYRYRTLLATATDAFFLYDLKGKLVDVNQQTCTMLGYSREEILSLSIFDVKIGATPDNPSSPWHNLKDDKTVQYESIYRHKDGTGIPVEVSLGQIKMGDEKLYSVLTRDVTERKKSEAILLEAKKEAEAANAAKSEFLSRMSHELRTPMNAILGFAQLLNMDPDKLTKNQQDNVAEILDAGQHLLYLINEVLDIARIEAGKLEVTIGQVALNDVIGQCLPLIEHEVKIRHVKLVDNISDKGFAVLADLTRLKQVILNLLSNAVKYNREYGQITLDAVIIRKNRLRINIADTGEGLTAAQIAKLFAPFERISAKKNIEGAGIGLVITKHLIELMGGAIGVESRPDIGSVFWVELALFNQNKKGLGNEKNEK